MNIKMKETGMEWVTRALFVIGFLFIKHNWSCHNVISYLHEEHDIKREIYPDKN